MNNFAFTCGDINGIGPEIVIKAINKIVSLNHSGKLYVLCPANVFYNTLQNVKPDFEFDILKNQNKESNQLVSVINIGNVRQNLGKPSVTSGKTAYKSLSLAYDLLKSGKANAVVTAPVSKTAINKAGYDFRGQTELYAKWTNTSNFVMTFLSQKINAALLTIHCSLKNVHNLINIKKLESTINVILKTLKYDLRISNPRIAVLGLNPHAGENGIIGDEERSIILPVIKKFRKTISIDGPFASDAFFANQMFNGFDMTLGMYHDQILIPFKLLNFGQGVNYTAGLPIVRTSPDHGVAYDIADKYIADESSIVQAYRYALRIVKNRQS
ncbi:MAG: 4-hydroxythreonine-4-phosphate dehydrogenase PdxA [Ignavibacteriaceae bacterium]